MNKNLIIITFILLLSSSQTIIGKFIKDNSVEPADTLFQIQDSTINKVWEIDLNTSTSLEPLFSDNQLFSPSDDGLIYCYDINGNKKWITEITGNITSNIVRFKDLVLTATTQGDLYSINANNGDVVQVMGIGEKITTNLLLIDFLNANILSEAVVFGTDKGNVFCYDIFSFEMVWKNNSSDAPLISNLIQLDDKLIFKNNSSTLYCLNSKSGVLIWKYNLLSKDISLNKSSILSDGKSVFALSNNNEIFSLDVLTGRKNWSTKPLDVLQQIYLSYNKQELILLNRKGEFIFISSGDGKELGKAIIKNENLSGFNCANAPGFSIISTSDGTVFKIADNYSLKELLKFSNSDLLSIKALSEKQFIISTYNGKILLFKFD